MAALHQQYRSYYDRVFFASTFSDAPRRGSTSQMCLHKILSIITTVSPPLAKESSEVTDASGKRSGFDLNLGFSVISQELNKETDSSGLSSCTTTAGDGTCAAENDGGCLHVCDRVEKEGRSLALLIEAAELIFGEFQDGDRPESSETQNIDSEVKRDEAAADIEAHDRKLRRRTACRWTVAEMGGEFEETPSSSSSPVVRSKRGRPQVLPGKFRDSVLEPLTRLSRSRASSIPSSKRRRR